MKPTLLPTFVLTPFRRITFVALTLGFFLCDEAASQPVQGERWVNIGPSPLMGVGPGGPQAFSGRVRDIAVDPSDPSHWFIGGETGGIWETRDGGTNWTPRTDDQPSLVVGAIAVAPSNPSIVYAGTGSVPFSVEHHAEDGLLKSIDGGVTWQFLATSTLSKQIFREIEIDFVNPDIVLAATSSGQVATSQGILKSIDGGVSWMTKLNGPATDLEGDPNNFNRQYAGVGGVGLPGSASNGIYRSLDAGESWIEINGPWNNPSLSTGIGSVRMAIAPSNPNVLYVSIRDGRTFGSLLGIWRTDNAWDPAPSWTQLPPNNGEYLGHTHEIIVDLTNPRILYSGGVQLWKFDGVAWNNVTANIHVDQISMTWAGDRLVVGNDGGIFSTADGARSWMSHNTNLSVIQFIRGSVHPTDSNFALGGSWDNGTERWSGMNAWKQIAGGDGTDNAISSGNPNTHWVVSNNFDFIRRTTDGGRSFTAADAGIDQIDRPLEEHFEKCPSNDDIFIAGTDNLWKSTDFFSAANPSWSPNSPDVARIEAMAFAPSDATCSTYAFGTHDGQLHLTFTGGSTWIDLDVRNLLPNRGVSDLAFDPANANILYVAFSGRDEETPTQPGHLFKTTTALSNAPTWSNISPPVNLSHNAIAVDSFDSNIVYVGTDRGVWKSLNGGGTWAHMGPATGMPNVPVFDLQINSAANRLIAFTFGRGAFALGAPLPAVVDLLQLNLTAPPNGMAGENIPMTDTVLNVGTTDAGGFCVSLFLSTDPMITPSDTFLGSRCLTGLASGQGSTASTSVTIPANVAAGTYWLGAISDLEGRISEGDESNNSLTSQTIVISSPTPPDLVMTVVSGPSRATVGSTITLSGEICNQGTGGAHAPNIGFYLSADTTITTSDIFVSASGFGGDLATGSCFVSQNVPGTIPSGVAPGEYFIGAIGDHDHRIPESNENNNALAGNRMTLSANQPPTARFSANPTSGPAPLTVHFDGSASSDPDGTIASYAWNFGDGTTGTGAMVGHTYMTAGTFTATLTVTDDQGATGSAQTTITVTSAISFGDNFNRTNSTNLGPDWNEYIPDFEIFSNQIRSVDTGNNAAQFIRKIGADQEVSVDCKVTAGNNMCAVMARWSNANNFYRARLDAGLGNIKIFKTVGGVTTELGVANRVLQFDTYYRIRLVVRGSALTLFFADETTPAISVTDTSLSVGDFAGILSFSSAAQTTWFDNFSVFAGNQSPTARLTANPTSGSAPLAVHFDGSASSDPDGTIASYAWNFGDGMTGTGPIVDHTYSSPGTFTATLTVTDNQGATGSAQTTITVASAVLFSDNFNRPDSTNLGANWNEYLPNLEIFSNQVRTTTTGSIAAIVNQSFGPDQDVSVDCKVTATRNNCAVMARWSNASNFYRVRFDVGARDIRLFKTVNGTTTLLGTATRAVQFNTYFRIRLVVRGTSLQVFFADETTPAISVNDTSLSAGNFAGIRAFTSAAFTAWFDNFNVTTPGGGPSPIACTSTRRDPYIAFTTTNSTVIAWQCAKQATIRWGVAPNMDQSADATAATDHHQFKIINLASKTTYAYQIEVNGAVLGSGAFTTAPTPAENRFKFAAFADSGDGSASQRAVANLLAGSDMHFAVIAGDVIYDRGADFEFDPHYFVPYKGIIHRTPFFPVVGNHDILADGGASFKKNFHHPEGTLYFDFQWGDTHFIALDSNKATDAVQKSWLSSKLAGSRAKWKIVYFHHAPFSSGTTRGSNLSVRSNWVPLFEQHQVDLVIAAHEHNYERTIPINGVTYIVTGGGGNANLYPVGTSSFTAFSRSIHHATFITMTPTTLTIAATDTRGVVFDSHTISKGANQSPTARLTANPTSGSAPLAVHFDGSTSSDPDGTIVSYAWNFGDGTTGTGPVVDHTYNAAGTFTATLTVTDNQGAAGSAQTTITATSGTAVLFNDEFNRTTGLGTNWRVTAGRFSTDGNVAISGGTANAAAITQGLGTNDYTVETVMIIPTGSQFSGIIARGRTDASFTLDLYSAQLHTNGTVNLYRRNAGAWTLLKSAPAGIAANRPFTLGLKVTGSNPVNLEVFLTGSPLFTFTDSSASRIRSGIPGMINYHTGVRYDRFTVLGSVND